MKEIQIQSTGNENTDIIKIDTESPCVTTNTYTIGDIKQKLHDAEKNKLRAEKEIIEYEEILKDYNDNK